MVAINVTEEAFQLLEQARKNNGVNKKFIASKIIIENIHRYVGKK